MSHKVQFRLDHKKSLEDYIQEKYPDATEFRVLSKSLDARGAPTGKEPSFQYHIELAFADNPFEVTEEKFMQLQGPKAAPIIIGAGPAGLFCALRFAEYGIATVVIERGERATKRMRHIARHWRYGEFNSESNVCYGEGGAGLFSDGKLITRIKSPYVKYVMKKFVQFGAPAETEYVSNPHLGSNKIRKIITQLTDYLKEKGHEFHYNSCVEKLIYSGSKVVGVQLKDGRKLFSDHIILATGHSASEMYHHLYDNKVMMKKKDFAVGVRIEHSRRVIDQLQYGDFSQGESGLILGAARYRLSRHDHESERGTYSFCMCPGGYVLSSGTDGDGIVVNGMSNYSRNSPWSNSALVVTVKNNDDVGSHILSGLNFQRNIEKKAYELSLEKAYGREIPSLTVNEFLTGTMTKKELPKSSCPSGLFKQNLDQILPDFITDHLRRGLEDFDKKIKGFSSVDALLLAPETRTSAPVTIERDHKQLISNSHSGLYPCGEGAGYAGGITSAAVDGVKVAMAIIEGFL